MRINELIVYKDLDPSGLLNDMEWLAANYEDDFYNTEDKAALYYSCAGRLLEAASGRGFYGNLWHCYLTDLLVNHENAYSIACEVRDGAAGTINRAALHDIGIIREFYDFDFESISRKLGAEAFDWAADFEAPPESGRIYNTRIRDRILTLAAGLRDAGSAQEMKSRLTEFYRQYGVGRFGLHKAFRLEQRENGITIVPIPNIAHVRFDDLVGYDIPKKKLRDNTEAFVSGKKANNCLLFGDAGTGKSSSIKALANEYYDRGLRIIEVYKHQFRELNDVIGQIKHRNYKFIIFMDDLSFEDFETEYKYLKAVIEGGLEQRPDNVLIYATSNRRHLVREKFSDKEDRRDDLHAGDTVQEKLSLVSRFGVSIFFCAPDKKQFREIVRALAEKNHLEMPEEELLLKANQWELSHGGLSGRTAQQFIDYLLGQ